MYLINGKSLQSSAFIDALLTESEVFTFVFNIETGEVIPYLKSGGFTSFSSEPHMYEIEPIPDDIRLIELRRCFDTMICLDEGDEKSLKKIQKKLSQDISYQDAIIFLKKEKEWDGAWQQWLNDSAWEDMMSILENIGVDTKIDPESLCDDCPLCQGLLGDGGDHSCHRESFKKNKASPTSKKAATSKREVESFFKKIQHEIPVAEPIVNPDRKRQMKYLDLEHSSQCDAFWGIFEGDPSLKILEKRLKNIIYEDPDYFDPYIELVDVLIDLGKGKDADRIIAEGYRRACLLMVDSKGRWPKEILWGLHENRHLMRMLDCYASMIWKQGHDKEITKDIYGKLLQANPHDNQGVRYKILALLMNLGWDWEKDFLKKHPDIPGDFADPAKIEKWFNKNVNKFLKEFDEWKKEIADII